uniref:Bet v I/Major latex protein domain-containing protein n=1 Tax=Oryza punctata TaxID=4537 RepID=A0A0E0LC64_ORYPU
MNGAGHAGGAAAGKLPAVSLRRVQWRLADERCELWEEKMEYGGFTAMSPAATSAPPSSPSTMFDQPQLFKTFVRKCVMRGNIIDTGSVREVNVQSGLPATRSIERLELLDDKEHILQVKFIGDDHKLKNYSSILTVHSEDIDCQPGTLVIESFVVDVPEGNTEDDICYFIKNVLRCNLRTFADVSEEHRASP